MLFSRKKKEEKSNIELDEYNNIISDISYIKDQYEPYILASLKSYNT